LIKIFFDRLEEQNFQHMVIWRLYSHEAIFVSLHSFIPMRILTV